MRERRAAVVTTAAAASSTRSGASLRVDDVLSVLHEAGYRCSTVSLRDVRSLPSGLDVGVAVSYVCSPALRPLQERAGRVWLDAVDSWLRVDASGVRAGHASYMARALRDGARLALAPRVDLVTYISQADLHDDRGTVRGHRRLVLPGGEHRPVRGRDEGPRLVVVGDWAYGPNRDGMRWLQRRVLPLLRAPVHVYGTGLRGPEPDGLLVHGYAEDDSDVYGDRDVHLAPVRSGGGVKRKVLQPLLAGLPVVTTPAGARGLARHPLLHVARTPERFAALANGLLGTSTVRQPVPGEQVYDRDDRPELLRWLRADDGRAGR